MTTFLATLSADHASNWDICKRDGLWGTGTSAHAKAAARKVQPGDRIVVWQSKAGVIALAQATSAARAVTSSTSVPWPEPQRYSYTFSISVLAELDEPIPDRFEGMTSTRFGIKTHFLQAGLIAVPEDVGTRLLEVFPTARDAAIDLDGPPNARPVPTRERSLAGVYLRPAGSVAEALLALYRRAASDPEAEMLVIGEEGDRVVVDAELSQEPFDAIRDRIRFATAEELGDELRERFSGK